jgi:hypothetical protein
MSGNLCAAFLITTVLLISSSAHADRYTTQPRSYANETSHHTASHATRKKASTHRYRSIPAKRKSYRPRYASSGFAKNTINFHTHVTAQTRNQHAQYGSKTNMSAQHVQNINAGQQQPIRRSSTRGAGPLLPKVTQQLPDQFAAHTPHRAASSNRR